MHSAPASTPWSIELTSARDSNRDANIGSYLTWNLGRERGVRRRIRDSCGTNCIGSSFSDGERPVAICLGHLLGHLIFEPQLNAELQAVPKRAVEGE
jgi:hypothetical protein